MAKRTNQELRQALQQKAAAGASLADLKSSFAGQKLGGSVAQKVYGNWAPPASSGSGGGGGGSSQGGGATTPVSTGGEFPWDKYANLQIDLTNLQGGYSTAAAQIGANAAVSSAGIRADADKEVAKAYADAQKYASGLSLEGVKYGADKESEWRQAVANIEVKGKLDLQPIINAGLERVAGIEAQASRDVAETTGKYSLESMKQRTAADKSIGKMQLAGGMYNLLGSIFG
jgi:hypothetical protein